jgi:hypothetical protein
VSLQRTSVSPQRTGQKLHSFHQKLQVRRHELHSPGVDLEEPWREQQSQFLLLHFRLLTGHSIFHEVDSRSQERQDRLMALHSPE